MPDNRATEIEMGFGPDEDPAGIRFQATTRLPPPDTLRIVTDRGAVRIGRGYDPVMDGASSDDRSP
jgi:hypothetical protein